MCLESIRRGALAGGALARAYVGTVRLKLLKSGAVVLRKTLCVPGVPPCPKSAQEPRAPRKRAANGDAYAQIRGGRPGFPLGGCFHAPTRRKNTDSLPNQPAHAISGLDRGGSRAPTIPASASSVSPCSHDRAEPDPNRRGRPHGTLTAAIFARGSEAREPKSPDCRTDFLGDALRASGGKGSGCLREIRSREALGISALRRTVSRRAYGTTHSPSDTDTPLSTRPPWPPPSWYCG